MSTGALEINQIVRIRNERWRIQQSQGHADCRVVEVTGVDSTNRGRRASFILPFETCDRLPADDRPRRLTARGWRRCVRRLIAEATPNPMSLRCAVRAAFDPLPFQLEPALACLHGEAARFLIADAVGLGKTIQAGLIVAEIVDRPGDARALIVVPAGLRQQWQSELHHHFGLRATVFDTAGLGVASRLLPPGINPWSTSPIVVTSIDYVKRPDVLRSLEPLVWDIVVFDEAHILAGRSDRHAAASGLAARARVVVLLTATPHSGDADAFARLCRLGDHDGRFPLKTFRRTRAGIGVSRTRRSRWLRLRPSAAESLLQQQLVAYARAVWSETPSAGAQLAMMVLLKRAASSASALTRSLERRQRLLALQPEAPPAAQLVLPMAREDEDEPGIELGAPGLSDSSHEREVLDQLIAAARHASTDSRKASSLLRLMTRSGEPAIVFTQYRDTLDELAEMLASYTAVSVHGGMSARQRRDALEAFASGAARVLLATDAASEGLNLHQRCRLVISFDLPWSPVRIEQRIGRVDRIGQTRRVHAWQMVGQDTFEETVAVCVQRKASIADTALGSPIADEHAATVAVLASDSGTVAEDGTVGAPVATRVSQRACDESQRIVEARGLLRHASTGVTGRAFWTLSRARNRARPVLAYRIWYSDPSGKQYWDELAGVLGQPLAGTSGFTVADPWLSETLLAQIRKRGEQRVREFSAWRRMTALLIHRDRSIRRVLRVERARLSRSLLQPNLFSRRAELTVTPQLQLLDEAVSRLDHSTSQTRAVARLRVEAVVPLFALIP